MERDRSSEINRINKGLAKTFKDWQKAPDNQGVIEMMDAYIKDSYKIQAGLSFGVYDKALKKGEGSRAILHTDLYKLAVKKGDVWIFSFKPSIKGRYMPEVINNYLRIMDGTNGEMVPGAYFGSEELAGISVR